MDDRSTTHHLTDVLLSPLRTSGPSDLDRVASLFDAASQIPAALAALATPKPDGGPIRLTDHDVRTALAPPRQGTRTDTPFAWSARTARRALGLAAVRSLVKGDAHSLAEAAQDAVAHGVSSVREGERPPSSLDRWLSGLPAAGRAAVQAEAVTWATRLWCALDWRAFVAAPIIGRDRWWDSPHSSLLAIRSRAEVRSEGIDGAEQPFSVHLVVLGGPRRSTVRAELSVVAMVETLRASRSLPPGRIVGWWPDSGHLVSVEVDRIVVGEGAATVARAIARIERARTPADAETRGAA